MTIDRLARVVSLRLRSVFRRDAVEQELDDELRDHLECQIAENVRQGMSPEEARYAALRAIGGVQYQKEQVRDTRGTRWLDDLTGDLRFALRSLRRARGFAAAVVLTLALGIGANTAMFTLLRGTLLRGLPNRNGDQLVYLRQSAPGAERGSVLFSVPEVADYRAAAKTLGAIAEFSSVMPFTLVGENGEPKRVKVGVVSGNYFDVMGLAPVAGRLTSPGDDGASAPPIAVLSHKFWTEQYASDPRIVGKTVRVNDRATTIVGVVESAPQYPVPVDVYVNTVVSPHHLSAQMVTGRSHRMSEIFARLAPNASVEQARAEITRISGNIFKDHPEAYEKAAHYEISVSPLKQALDEKASLMFWVLMGAALFVLLISCANVANLTLMRGVGREREMLVRAALGAGTVRLRRLLIVENLTLALFGGVLGLLVAVAGLKLLVSFAAQFSPRASEIRVDGVVLAVGLLTSLAAAVALSFIPRIDTEQSLAAPIASGGRRVTLGRGRQRVQRALVVAQVALCMILLTGAGLLMRTLSKLQSVDTGVRAEHVLSMDLPIEGDLLKEIMKQPEHLAKYESIRDRVAALPGVTMVSLANAPPLKSTVIDLDLKAEGKAISPNHPTPHPALRMIDPTYLAASGIPVVSGRTFTSTDRRGSPLVVLLSQSFAKQLFGDEDPIGRRVAMTGPVLRFTPFTPDWRTVVGVVGDTRDKGLDSSPTATMYMPFAQEFILNGTLVVRTASDPEQMQQAVQRAVHDVVPRQLIEHVETLDQMRDESVAPRRLNAMFISAFGTLAFLIAMVGIAGVLAFSVSSRTNEIGIRMSLGADAARVRRMVLGEGGALLGVGLLVGFGGAFFAAQLLQRMLFGVTPHDPATLAIVALVLLAVGIAACWVPAARAAHVDPAVALRAE